MGNLASVFAANEWRRWRPDRYIDRDDAPIAWNRVARLRRETIHRSAESHCSRVANVLGSAAGIQIFRRKVRADAPRSW